MRTGLKEKSNIPLTESQKLFHPSRIGIGIISAWSAMRDTSYTIPPLVEHFCLVHLLPTFYLSH